jgi:hypothetical protein
LLIFTTQQYLANGSFVNCEFPVFQNFHLPPALSVAVFRCPCTEDFTSIGRIKVGGFRIKRVTCCRDRDVIATETSFVAYKLSHRRIFVGHSHIRISYIILNWRVVDISDRLHRKVGTKLPNYTASLPERQQSSRTTNSANEAVVV